MSYGYIIDQREDCFLVLGLRVLAMTETVKQCTPDVEFLVWIISLLRIFGVGC